MWLQGQVVKARVIGHRPMDGVAVMTMRPDVVEQLLLSHADVSVGQMIIGTIVKVEDYGLVVQLTPSIKALCPTLHMSDSGTAYAKKKFAEGKKVMPQRPILACCQSVPLEVIER